MRLYRSAIYGIVFTNNLKKQDLSSGKIIVMENTERKTELVSRATFGAGKPVAPFSGKATINNGRSLDPSSCLRADRYPIPNSFEFRSSSTERGLA